MACAICQTRRPRRFCPGVRGDICTICCGTEREISVDCPLECEYLREAHKHEKPPAIPPKEWPNRDLIISADYIEKHHGFLSRLAATLGLAAIANPAIVDYDVREALEAAIRTQRTLESGLYYESLPPNPLAAGLCRALIDAIEEFRRAEVKELGIHKTPSSVALRLLAFLQHFELTHNNGRKRSRAFLDALMSIYAAEPEAEGPGSSPLILP
jgi:hypothetical protein